jgi:hypothetical protein
VPYALLLITMTDSPVTERPAAAEMASRRSILPSSSGSNSLLSSDDVPMRRNVLPDERCCQRTLLDGTIGAFLLRPCRCPPWTQGRPSSEIDDDDEASKQGRKKDG